MKIIKCDVSNARQEVEAALTSDEEKIVYMIPETPVVTLGYKSTVSNAISSVNIQVINIGHGGGTIVHGKGSICITHYSKTPTFGSKFANKLVTFLREKGLNCKCKDNDVLVDDVYKVASYGSHRYKDTYLTAFQIGFGTDIDLIKLLCTKQINKIPRGLDYYNLTSKELEDFFLNNCE